MGLLREGLLAPLLRRITRGIIVSKLTNIVDAMTKTASSKPMLSTTICRFRPLTFLALSRPRCSPPPDVSTD